MASSEMKGLRSRGVIAYVKHFALNDQETNRIGGAIFANEQEIREICFKGFEGAVVDGKATAAMVAMNRLGARWAGAHKGAMTNVLRKEWGFKGMTITDQASVPAMFYQDIVSGLWAGCDMWLNTNSEYWSLEAVKNSKTMQYYIHNSAKNILYSITNSWAVNEGFKSNGNVIIEDTSKVFPWKALLWTVDALLWTVTATSLSLLAYTFINNKKKEEK